VDADSGSDLWNRFKDKINQMNQFDQDNPISVEIDNNHSKMIMKNIEKYGTLL
jgi:hypothetical protein